jgi:NAD-dependent deacetylase
MREDVERLNSWLDVCSRAVVFTGAGISTESGIPDFRSPDGIWSKMKPVYFDEFLASEEARREAWRRKLVVDEDMASARPNKGHEAVSELVKRGIVSSVITQNIDGLHQRSGVPEECIIELHGNSTYATCLDCTQRYELEPILDAFKKNETLPVCGSCGGMVKTATVSFGQPMPDEAMQRAEAETLACDLFLAVGSSLVVYPAAAFPAMAKQNGARLVIINREPTGLDHMADMVLNTEIGPTLTDAVT